MLSFPVESRSACVCNGKNMDDFSAVFVRSMNIKLRKEAPLSTDLKQRMLSITYRLFPMAMNGLWLPLIYLVQCTFSDKESNLNEDKHKTD